MVLWQGCVQPSVAPEINAAAARVLDRFGIQVLLAGDGCCGAISHHTAAIEHGRMFARRNIDMLWPYFEAGAEALVITASGCSMHFREYGELLRDDKNYRDRAQRLASLTRDIADVIAEVWPQGSLPSPASQRRVAFQASCSLQHGERLNGVVEQILRRAGFKILRVAYSFMCCGAAGAYMLLQRELSKALRQRRLETLLALRPELIATTNIGCLIHMAPISPVPIYHWIELLDQVMSTHSDGHSVA
jgi:glycolate oxidase iron-sulfur subunit